MAAPDHKPKPCRSIATNAFNIVLLKLIKEARAHAPFKKAFDAAFRAHSSSSDRFVFDKGCEAHPNEFAPLARVIAADSAEPWSLDMVLDSVVVVGLPVSAFVDALDAASLENYLITLTCLWLIFDSPSPVQADVEALVSKLQSIECGEEVDIDDVMDDRVNKLLQRLINNSVDSGVGDGAAGSGGAPDLNDVLKVKPEEFMASLQDSKIASLAQEISSSINLGDDPKEVLSGGGIGTMIKTVSDTINRKINDGSLNHQELLSEALGVMKSLNTSKIFKNMNVNMGALQQAARMNETRSRLREKAARRAGGPVEV